MTCTMQKALAENRIITDGTYHVVNGKVEDYAAKWAYGYIVATGALAQTAWYPAESRLLRWVEALSATGPFGVWKDENGVVYVDSVEHVAERATALERATDRGEKAIWSLRDNECVYV